MAQVLNILSLGFWAFCGLSAAVVAVLLLLNVLIRPGLLAGLALIALAGAAILLHPDARTLGTWVFVSAAAWFVWFGLWAKDGSVMDKSGAPTAASDPDFYPPAHPAMWSGNG